MNIWNNSCKCNETIFLSHTPCFSFDIMPVCLCRSDGINIHVFSFRYLNTLNIKYLDNHLYVNY